MDNKPTYEELEQQVRELKKAELERQRTEVHINRMSDILSESQRIAHIGSFEYLAATQETVWSDEEFRIYGIEPSKGSPTYQYMLENCIHPDDAELLDRTFKEAFANGEVYDLVHKIVQPGGAVRIVHDVAHPYFDESGNLYRYIGVTLDITERKQAEQKLLESDERFLAAQEMSPDGFTILRPVRDDQDQVIDFTWIYQNKAVAKMNGTDPQKVVGQSLLKLFPGHQETQFFNAYKQVAETGRPITFEDKYVGETIKKPTYFRIVVVPMGENIAILNQDITERKRVEEALREREEMMCNSQSVAHICSYSTNLNVNEIEKSSWVCSPEFYNIFGIDETYPHTIAGWTNFIHPDYREEIFDYHECVVKEKKTFNREYKIIRINDGAERWVHGTGELEFDEKGNPVRMHGAIQDITERKQSEAEKEKLQSQLIQAQKMEAVGRLAGGVAHDFNNMLSVIIGNADMALEDMDLSPQLSEILQEIKTSGERSASLTRQLLAFARKETVSPKVVDINKTVGSMTKMLQRLIGEDIDLALALGSEVWPVKIDPSQIDQILANLCVNSRDALADVGKITIETANFVFDETYCSYHLGFSPGEYVLLAVSDNGCGMDADTLENIFEPFFTTKETNQGTGLGLATVYGVVKQNEGFVNVYSEPGHGTTIKIYLPRYRSKTDLLPEKAKKLTTEFGKETILLVEDELAILKMTTRMLEGLGYTVVPASTPGEAISLAQEHAGEIHMLLTDVVMPEMNGRDLAKNILSSYPNLKRLFMSGYTENVIAHHGVLDEGVNFIHKPFSREQFAAKVRKVLDEVKGSAQT